MKIDLTTIINDLDGNPLKMDESTEMTFADAFKTALLANLESDKDMTADEKLKNWELAKLVKKNEKGSIELKTEQVTHIKDRIHKTFPSPIIYGAVSDIIEK